MKPKVKIAYVKWLDASAQKGYVKEKDMDDEYILESAGILVKEGKKTITLAEDFIPKNDEYRDVQHIPKVNIIRKDIIVVDNIRRGR